MRKPSERLKKKVERENLWLFVLSLLTQAPMNGARIRALVRERFGFLTGNVTVYKILYLLEAGGYVSSERTDGKSVSYKITAAGRQELQKARTFLKDVSKNL